MKRIVVVFAIALLCAGCFMGCATRSASTLIRALSKDPSGFTLNVDTLYGKIHIVRANPGMDTPPYTLSPDGTVRVLENTQATAPVSRDEVLLQTLKKVPNQQEAQ